MESTIFMSQAFISNSLKLLKDFFALFLCAVVHTIETVGCYSLSICRNATFNLPPPSPCFGYNLSNHELPQAAYFDISNNSNMGFVDLFYLGVFLIRIDP